MGYRSGLLSSGPLASNPGPHHHRICDRREEGLVKPPFCFAPFPTTVGNDAKISHSNYLTWSAVFKSVFDTQKRRGVARRRLSLSRYKHKAKLSFKSSSTPQHAQKKRRGKDEDFLVQISLTLWPPKFTVHSERNVFPSSFSCFFFFFCVCVCVCRTFSCRGKHQSLALQHQFRTRGVGQAWPWSACPVRKKGCISSPNNASAPKGVPCRRRALFVIMATKLNKPGN